MVEDAEPPVRVDQPASLSDLQESLTLFAEAIAGVPITFTAVVDDAACWPTVPSTPGVTDLPLPATASGRGRYRTLVLQQVLTAPVPDGVGQHRPLFSLLYALAEDLRATAVTRVVYPGAVGALDECLADARAQLSCERSQVPDIAELLQWRSVGGVQAVIAEQADAELVAVVWKLSDPLLRPGAGPADSARVTERLLLLCEQLDSGRGLAEIVGELDDGEPPVETDRRGQSLDGGTPTEVRDQPGSIAGGQVLSDLEEHVPTEATIAEEEPASGGLDLPTMPRPASSSRYRTFVYDEWDYHEQRHRAAWCRVIEEQLEGTDLQFLGDVRRRHVMLRSRIRNSLRKLPPRELVRVPRSYDGDELDLDAAIEARADRRSGAPADDRLQVRRDRGARDVATAFLVDLSASTSSPSVVPVVPEPEPVLESDPADDPMSYGPLWDSPPAAEPVRRIIDVAKDAVTLMGDALQELGDRFAIYGFSGTGRENVEFKIGKDFEDGASAASWAAVEAMKPLRYTRMGPAIRHATAKLAVQPARTRMLLVISDGYPQDIDYGIDRHDRDYGMHDTARALADATDLGIQTFCVTIDPAGHDYLGQMCPDDRYAVIEDVESLPEQLAKLYFLELAQ